MKRTFLAKRNALLSSAGLSWGAYALIFAVLVLLVRLLAPNLFWQAFTPAFNAADALAAKSHFFFSSFDDAATLSLRNEQLIHENAALANENQTLLEKARGIAALGAAAGIRAGVVARPPESPYDTLVLAGGSADGIRKGMEAFGAGGVPLGIVSSVSASFSRVTLFSAPGVVTDGWVGHQGLPLTIAGAGAGAMNASLARSAPVSAGDTVFAPGPGMLPLGTVVRIDSDPSAPGVTLHIQSSLNLFSVTWVLLRDTGAAFVGALREATSTLP